MALALARQEIVVHNNLQPMTNRSPGLHAVAAFPLVEQGKAFGLLSFWDRESMSFPQERVEKVATLVQVATLALTYSRQYAKVQQMAFEDPLTKLRNRAGFERELEARSAGGAGSQAPFAFAILDLDNFKRLNDTFGHPYGDKALQDIGKSIGWAMQPGDMAARLGGDEFIVLLDGTASAAEATARLEAVVQQLPLELLQVSVSAGVSLYPDEGRTYQELYRVADGRLYAAKEGGRNQILAVWTERRRQ
jgi:diguanylate cyclase (GGDEF)-like protein